MAIKLYWLYMYLSHSPVINTILETKMTKTKPVFSISKI